MDVKTQETYSEVYSVLNMLGDKYIKRLPTSLFNMIVEEKKQDYNPVYDSKKNLEEQNIKRESISMIALFHLNYWCDSEEEKKQLNALFKSNYDKKQTELREKYNPDNIFNNKEQQVINNIDQTFDEIDEIDRISKEESIKAEERVIEFEKRKEMEEQILSQKRALIDYNSFPWYKKAFTKVKIFLLNIFKGKKNIA